MPAAAITNPWWVCTIRVGPRRATTRAVSRGQDLLAGRLALRAVGRARRPAALRLRHDLAGDHQHVAVAQPGAARGDQPGQVVAGRTAPMPAHRQDLQTASRRSAPTPASVNAARTIAVGGRLVGHPQRSRAHRRPRAPRSPSSAVSTSQRVEQRRRPPGAVEPARPRPRCTPRRARPGTCRPCRAPARPDDRRDPDHRRPPPTTASRSPGTARIGAMLTTGLLGASSTTSAAAERLEHAGRRLGRLGADEDEPLGRQLAAVAHPPLLEVHRRAAAVGSTTTWVSTRSSLAGSSRHARAASGRTAPRSPPRAGSRRRASGCGPGGWPRPGRRGRTRSAPRRTRPAPP